MKIKILAIIMALLTYTLGNSQNSLWTKISEERVATLEKVDRASIPSEYELFRLDYEGLKKQLQMAPSRDAAGLSNVIISFPDAAGNLEKYRIYESSVMEAELASKQPEIQSYIGQGIDNPVARIHLTTTIFGLHVMNLSEGKAFYIDPYTKDLKNYIVYNKSSLTNTRNFECHVEDNDHAREAFEIPEPVTFSNDGLFRTYRMAMACTYEYATFHIDAAGLSSSATDDEKKNVVLAAMNITVTRLNTVYENDMSLRFVLVANNKNIIFIIPEDGFDNNDANTLIGQSQSKINSTIGSLNYDIGHTVSTGGGGLAQPSSVCVLGLKARGITGSPNPVGDPFDIDYVAHEVGHQFGASHTFNNSCQGNRSANFAVEPGSGSTILAYAGICPTNVQNNSDPYFHAVSIGQMMGHITSPSGGCASGVANGNTAPVITPLTSYSIPAGTAFVLRGNGTDTESTLTYCWEQIDAGESTSLPNPISQASNPNFRSKSPSQSPNRYMPALEHVMRNNLTGAAIPASQMPPGFPQTWEVVPSSNRIMNFALSVRDNQAVNGGQTSRQDMSVTFVSGGPFTVTSQNTAGITWTSTPQTITWNVGNSTVAPVSTANVNILLSTDGGLTFPITLAANTPNDGSQAITVPSVTSSTCRIMVEAVGNIFLAVNTTAFAINNGGLSTDDFGLKDFKLYPNPNTGNFSIEFNSETSSDIKISVYDIQGRQILDKTYQNTGIFSQNVQLNSVQAGVYLVNINDGDKKETRKVIIN